MRRRPERPGALKLRQPPLKEKRMGRVDWYYHRNG